VLEPWPDVALRPSRFRALGVRHGFDLEPMLPDPAPAWFDPDGTLHPALTEPLSALTLHRYPTPGARAALTCRLLSEPGRPRLDDPEDPFVRLYRFSAREDMEPEVTGCLALLLLREQLAWARREHKPSLPDPSEALRDPRIDVFRGRRARLIDTGWEPLRAEVEAAAAVAGDEPMLAFERETLLGSAHWLADYRAWWQVAALLGADEVLPEQHGPLQAALESIPDDLGAVIAEGAAAEAAFMAETGLRPDGPVTARWLLSSQVRALRDLSRSSRERSLLLHRLLRTCDVARMRAQIAYRALLLRLWLADDPASRERALLAIPDPPHPTTLGAGLGRLVGVVLLRRLRRGDESDAGELARRALALAPEELAVRLTRNDLDFYGGRHDPALLRSLREERDRWDSVSVCFMGARVADGLQERSTGRHFRDRLVDRALGLGTGSGWLLAVAETLGSPGGRTDRSRLEQLVAAQRPIAAPLDAIGRLLLGEHDEPEAVVADFEAALVDALADLETAAGLEGSPLQAAGKGKTPAWRQLVSKGLVAPDDPRFAGRLFARIQALRAAAPPLRKAPVAGQLRGLSGELAAAAELEVGAPPDLGFLKDALRLYLEGPDEDNAARLADWLESARAPLQVALRGPRTQEQVEQLGQLQARIRVAGRDDLSDQAGRIGALLRDPGTDLDEVGAAIAGLAGLLERPAEVVEQPGLMRLHAEFEAFSLDELGMRPEALARALAMVRLFNLSGGQRDRKRLKGKLAQGLYELRHRTARQGGLRVFYRRDGDGWLALAAMSKYDDRQQHEAIARVAGHFG
jgi:hypothetical protein